MGGSGGGGGAGRLGTVDRRGVGRYTGADVGERKGRRMRSLGLVLVGVLLGAASVLTVLAWTAPREQMGSLDTPARLGDVEVRIIRVGQVSPALLFCRVPRGSPVGWGCVVALVEFTNRSITTPRRYAASQFHLVQASSGDQYDSYTATLNFSGREEPQRGQLGEGAVAPGQAVRGSVWFQAPLQGGPYDLLYQPPQAGAAPVRVLLPDPLSPWFSS